MRLPPLLGVPLARGVFGVRGVLGVVGAEVEPVSAAVVVRRSFWRCWLGEEKVVSEDLERVIEQKREKTEKKTKAKTKAKMKETDKAKVHDCFGCKGIAHGRGTLDNGADLLATGRERLKCSDEQVPVALSVPSVSVVGHVGDKETRKLKVEVDGR